MPKPTEIDTHIGSQMRTLRERRGKSLEEVGQVLGISYQQVQKYETGGNRISAGRLHLVAKLFEVDMAAFFPAREDDHSGVKKASGKMLGELNRVVRLAEKLPADQVELLLVPVSALVRHFQAINGLD